MRLKSVQLVKNAIRGARKEIRNHGWIVGTWIDVGAHYGELTLSVAQDNPGLRVFAIEPNLRAAARLMGRAPNYIVIPMAVAEKDGSAEFHLNAFEASSSLLPLNEEGVESWIGGDVLKVESSMIVPTIRLDTFMDMVGIDKVDFLKVDAQGMDLAVVKSAGARIRDIEKIVLEVDVAPLPLYSGAASKDDVLTFLYNAGFVMVSVEKQTHGQEENLMFVRINER